MTSWDYEMEKRFKEFDKDGSGELSKGDILVMLLNADKDDKTDPMFKMNIKFLMNCIKNADKNDDASISLAEFKAFIGQASAAK